MMDFEVVDCWMDKDENLLTFIRYNDGREATNIVFAREWEEGERYFRALHG